MKKQNLNILKDIVLIVIGNAILAFAVGVFMLPSNILSGGVAGIAVLVGPFISLSKTAIVSILTVTLFIVGAVALGKKFALQTLLSSLLYPFFLTLISSTNYIIESPDFLAALYGGLLAGAGIGIVIRTGASTGGMDIPPLILHKLTKIEISTLILIVDAMTVLLGLFIYGIEAVLVGLISVYTTSIGISKVMSFSGTSAKAVQIISDKWQEINTRIMSELDRGTTLTKAEGGYTSQEKVVILVVISHFEYTQLIDIINDVDRQAFVIVSETTEVHGEGFSIEARV